MSGIIKRVISVAISLVILLGAIPILSVNAASLPATVVGNTISDITGVPASKYVQWLKSHEKDNYYLGTHYPTEYYGGDCRNPKGDPGTDSSLRNLPSGSGYYSSYGILDTPGVASMNCTGFIWHALVRVTKANGGKYKNIPGESGWVNYYKNNKISRRYFKTKKDMLSSGYLTKGDIIWIFVKDEHTISNYNHVGFYWGDGKSDKFWHSSDVVGNAKPGNVITSIIPQDPKSQLYVVLKLGNEINLTMQKSSSVPEFTNSIPDYSLDGAVYSIFTSKAAAQAAINSGNRVPSTRFGWIQTKSEGAGNAGVVPRGNYYAIECVAPPGYKLSNTVYQFKDSGKKNGDGVPIFTLTCTDYPLIKLQILKSSANPDITDGNNCYSLEGSKYNLYKDSSCTGKVYGSITVDSDGYGRYINSNGDGGDVNTSAKDKNTAAYLKPSGTSFSYDGVPYYCKEVTSSKGYEQSGRIYQFKYSGCASAGVPVLRAYSTSNGSQPKSNAVKLMTGIAVQKRACDAEKVNAPKLSGAVFEVKYYAAQTDKDYDVTPDDTAPPLNESTLKKTWYIKTDENGRALLNSDYLAENYKSDDFYMYNGLACVPLGTVTIREVEAPEGFAVSDTTFYRSISEQSISLAHSLNKPIEISVDEPLAKGFIEREKLSFLIDEYHRFFEASENPSTYYGYDMESVAYAEQVLNDENSSDDDYESAKNLLLDEAVNRTVVPEYAEYAYNTALNEHNYNGWYTDEQWSNFQAKLAVLGDTLKTSTEPSQKLTEAYQAMLKAYNEMTNAYTLKGDINKDGEIDVIDVTLVQKYIVGLENLTGAQKMLVSGKEYEIPTVAEATTMQKYVVGLIDKLPDNDVFLCEREEYSAANADFVAERTINFTICSRYCPVTSGSAYIDNNFSDFGIAYSYYSWCEQNGYEP